MSEGTPPPKPTEPAPPSNAPPSNAPPAEPFDVKIKRLIAPFMPPADSSQETPETKMLRAIYILIAAALVVIILCGGFALVISLFK